jgi:hypothetical protein
MKTQLQRNLETGMTQAQRHEQHYAEMNAYQWRDKNEQKPRSVKHCPRRG